MFHEYEIIVILRPDVDDADITAAIERVEATVVDQGGHILERDDWGKRKLAYLIDKHSKGHYFLLRTTSQADHILEVERRLRLDDRVIRFLTVKVAEAVDVDALMDQAEERRIAAAAAAAARAEADSHHNDDDGDDDESSSYAD